MTSLHDLLAACARAGLALDVQGDRLTFEPADAMTPALATQLRVVKTELLAWFRRADGARSAGKPDRPCGPCGCRHFTADVVTGAWTCARCVPPGVLRTDVEVWTSPRGGGS